MKYSVKVILSVLVLAFIFSSSVFAQQRKPIDPKVKDALKELRQSLKSWSDSNVLPELQSYKQKFDKSLSAEDIQKLNSLRTTAAELKAKRQDLFKTMIEAKKNKDADLAKATKEKLQALKDQHKQLFGELKPLAEKNAASLKDIKTLAEPNVKKWKSEAKEIFTTWLKAHQSELAGLKGKGIGKKLLERIMKFRKGEDFKKMIVARFMLWDGTNFFPEKGFFGEAQSEDQNGSLNTKASSSIELGNYPNPFNPSTTIKFNLPKDDHVTLKVYDTIGKEVAVLVNDNLQAGEHSVSFVPQSSLSSGVYIYRLDTSAGVVERKMNYLK